MPTFISIQIRKLKVQCQVLSIGMLAPHHCLSGPPLSIAAVHVRLTHIYRADSSMNYAVSSMNQAWYFPFSVSFWLEDVNWWGSTRTIFLYNWLLICSHLFLYVPLPGYKNCFWAWPHLWLGSKWVTLAQWSLDAPWPGTLFLPGPR